MNSQNQVRTHSVPAGATMKKQPSQQQVKKKVENLPRTGIEYPFMKHTQKFISDHKEYEPLAERVSTIKLEEYIKSDQERNFGLGPIQTIVYDCFDVSPFYEHTDEDPYINEKEAIELPPAEEQSPGLVTEPYQKKYQFSAQNLPYTLEKPNGLFQNCVDRKNPKLNRYYSQLKPYYNTKGDSSDDTLVFESRFESGNLKRAVKVGPREYDLYLRNDYATQGNTQWYYFRVQNTKKNQLYRFNIVNLWKNESTYNNGMKPLLYSVREADDHKVGWQRAGYNIAYYQNSRKKKQDPTTSTSEPSTSLSSMTTTMTTTSQNFYSLTFEIDFKYDNDTVYFAHCYPYTYTDLCNHIKSICTNHNFDKIRRTVLCKTLAGNDCEMVIITNFNSNPEEIAVRKAIILSSRVHPGETNASYIMQGTLDYLISEDQGAQLLRNTFVFKIIPMLNPDGVIIGNYRCSLAGADLNRQWIGPNYRLYPTNYHTKLMMKKTLDSRPIFFFCDFHGHSTNMNLFMFGNNQQKNNDKLKERVFPMLFNENFDYFNFEDCCFAVQKAKETAARVVMWRDFQLINSFTLECSFCGPTRGCFNGYHFTSSMMESMGRMFCKTLVDYSVDEARTKQIYKDLQIRFGNPDDKKQGSGINGNTGRLGADKDGLFTEDSINGDGTKKTQQATKMITQQSGKFK